MERTESAVRWMTAVQKSAEVIVVIEKNDEGLNLLRNVVLKLC